MTTIEASRALMRTALRQSDHDRLRALLQEAPLDDALRQKTSARGAQLVRDIRAQDDPGLMEVFLAEYGLSTDEGVALMCLAEALLRVPDKETMDDLIEDKIAPSEWGAHLGKSSSSLVNASTWALMLTGKVLTGNEEPGIAATLRGAIRRVGEPVIRTAVQRAMKELGHQFVLGRDIKEAISRGGAQVRNGYTYSYDMLGEAALTTHDAQAYFTAYEGAISHLAGQCVSEDIRENPGISIKLSALHPRYEVGQRARVMKELVASTTRLARQARDANMGLNIDAEEADRLDLSLDVIEAVLNDPYLAGWDGFGVVVQAYGKRAAPVLDWLYALAQKLDRRLMVRLVKGAYWDTEIKRAQVEGLDHYPVYTRKAATDVSYLCCAQKLLAMADRIYPQFATHNAHSVAAIQEMAPNGVAFEFQRLHGMGETLHNMVLDQNQTRCRIYAPVGAHSDLLAYLVRRLLENGANSSFVNQIVDEEVSPTIVAADPFIEASNCANQIPTGPALYAPERPNSKGFDLGHAPTLARIEAARAPWRKHAWQAGPLIAGEAAPEAPEDVINPSDLTAIGQVSASSAADVELALASAQPWAAPAAERAAALNRAADLYEEHFGELFAILAREAGKSIPDAVAELREAVDFLRYYAARIPDAAPAGLFTCISPWNFPLAIFTGQIAAALAAGNAVLAKPAETTVLVAGLAVDLLHKAGVPRSAMQLLPGRGDVVGAALTGDPRVDGVCFTGSTQTAQRINQTMAQNLAPEAPLIAETGGLNAMIVDSTALPEQAVRDIVASAFQSAGQRCSALRVLYLQEDIADGFLKMLFGAMDELVVGQPWDLATDVGPVIDQDAQRSILEYCDNYTKNNDLLKQVNVDSRGNFVAPAVVRVQGISDLTHEVFGPVLHVAVFKASELDQIIADVNASGYGLTFGLHTRIDGRVEEIANAIQVGNFYVNRNQIGAVVGSQPFGGEGLSGTGPKAGGPDYLKRFQGSTCRSYEGADGALADIKLVQSELSALANQPTVRLGVREMPGPTGESNRLSIYGRGTVLCLGPGRVAALAQRDIAHANGCRALAVSPDLQAGEGIAAKFPVEEMENIKGIDVVALWSSSETQRRARQALSRRDGPIIALSCGQDLAARCRVERHVCVDTTAAGGNASLLAGGE